MLYRGCPCTIVRCKNFTFVNSSQYFGLAGSSVVFHVQFLLIKISQQYNCDCDYPQMHTLNVRWVLRVVLGVGPYLQTPILSFPDYAFTWDLAQGGIALGRDANSYGCLEKATDRLKTQKWSDDDDDPSIDQG